nr:IS3 family transposase [Streptomyces halstedii]
MKLTTRLGRTRVQPSMGSVGDSYENAFTEHLWMLIKTECIRGRVRATRAEANLALFEYIDGFYNPRRIQKRLGYLSPIEYEEKHCANQAATEPVNLKPRHPALTRQSATPTQREPQPDSAVRKIAAPLGRRLLISDLGFAGKQVVASICGARWSGMGRPEGVEAVLAAKFQVLLPHLDECQRRLAIRRHRRPTRRH